MRRCLILCLAAACLLPGCHKTPPATATPAPRIVSFSPAITDMLFDMGLGEHVVGVTNYCQVPPGFSPPVVGDRGRVNAEAILAVRPDVVLIQQNPDDFGALRSLAPQIRLEHFEIETLADVAAAVERIGVIAGQEQQGRRLRAEFERKLQAVRDRVAGRPPVKALFLLGYERPAAAGKGTFLDEMIVLAGGTDAAAERGYSGWKTLNRENILAMAPDVVVCQVAPDEVEKATQYWRSFDSLPAVAAGRVHPVTDVRWTIPSLRSADYAEQLAKLLHPEAFAEGGKP